MRRMGADVTQLPAYVLPDALPATDTRLSVCYAFSEIAGKSRSVARGTWFYRDTEFTVAI
ncbi:hypothetical protein GCM10027406_16440 [Leifsonia lichenia]